MDEEKEFTAQFTLNEICIVLASLDVSLEDAIVAAMRGDLGALQFVEPMEKLIKELRAIRYGNDDD